VALLDSGIVMVEDDQSSRLYRIDSGGARLIGRAGDGPGEFRDIEVLTVARGDTVFAYNLQIHDLVEVETDRSTK
jgi:hypothetical protein